MSEERQIRALTYSNLVSEIQSSSKKWKSPNDDVFNKLGEIVSEDEQEKIADFLNLFYYFIICYSKKCFKKNGLWQTSKWKANGICKTLSREDIQFDYDLANENDSHSKILEIQRRMNAYRQEYKYAKDHDKLYLNDDNDKKREILLFIDESLEMICTDIQEPVIMTSYDIKAKVAKYTNEIKQRKKYKKSPKLNYAVLEALGIDFS